MIFMSVTTIIPVFAGWIMGFLVNYFADVLPRTRQISPPMCIRCEARQNIIPYMFLSGCANGHRRNLRAWVVHFFLVAASLYVWFSPPEKLGYLLSLILTGYFSLVFVVDLEHRLILHPTSLFGAVLGLVAGVLSHGFQSTLIGGLSGLLIMLTFYLLGLVFTRHRARKLRQADIEPDDEEALGAGDVILVSVLGFILGWPLIWFGLLFGILLGGAVSLMIVLWLVISRRYGQNALMVFIPYGPYFIISAYLIIFFPALVSLIVPA